ncbi:MAG: hypothetical protein JXB13_19540 [Phycisphaerae bacterium]|nr:hypothetical protein [Phycisphaerae bacterium]
MTNNMQQPEKRRTTEGTPTLQALVEGLRQHLKKLEELKNAICDQNPPEEVRKALKVQFRDELVEVQVIQRQLAREVQTDSDREIVREAIKECVDPRKSGGR